MRGIGTASGAISVVNALLSGMGCAAAVDLSARASVELEPSNSESSVRLAAECDTPLLRATLRSGLHRLGGAARFRGWARVESEVPWACGLKSSSAASAALLRALQSALDPSAVAPDEQLATELVSIHRRVGLTATGGFDDAMVALAGGVVGADNRSNRVTHRGEMAPDWAAVLWTPPVRHPAAPSLLLRFLGLASDGRRAAALASEGKYAEAMEINTRAVEGALGLDYTDLRHQVAGIGAVAAGISGLGPTLAVVAPLDRLSECERELGQSGGSILRVSFLRPRGSAP
ncbi:MAG: shikimate kinase [Thermoplasmata archaeon]|nr:shikimate kinase [Thermoplasmata archaeon]